MGQGPPPRLAAPTPLTPVHIPSRFSPFFSSSFFHPKWSPKGPHLGSLFQERVVLFSMLNCIDFFIDFLMDFGFILGGFWTPKFNKKRYHNEKGDFSKMSVSLTRELNFGGSRDPKSIPKASKRQLKKQSIF